MYQNVNVATTQKEISFVAIHKNNVSLLQNTFLVFWKKPEKNKYNLSEISVLYCVFIRVLIFWTENSVDLIFLI